MLVILSTITGLMGIIWVLIAVATLLGAGFWEADDELWDDDDE